MDKLRRFGSKITSRKSTNGKKSGRDKTLRYSRSMPLRSSSDTDASSQGLVLHIRPTDEPKILDELGYERQLHHADCDCWDCEHPDLLGQFPAPPPVRPKTRPPAMEQDFDDIAILPDDIYERRKRLREKDRRDAEERQRILGGVLAVRARIADGDCAIPPEEPGVLGPHLIFGHANLSTRSLGPEAHYRQGPLAQRPVVRKASTGTIASYHPRMQTSPLATSARSHPPVARRPIVRKASCASLSSYCTRIESPSPATAPSSHPASLRSRNDHYRPRVTPRSRERSAPTISDDLRRRLLSNPRRVETSQKAPLPIDQPLPNPLVESKGDSRPKTQRIA